jgi:histidinol-phosphatase (PHP family)
VGRIVIVDYHMHLRDERNDIDHTANAAENFVRRARERGVDEIGFTEHVYYFRQTRECWSRPYQVERCVYDLDVYVDAVLEAKRRGLPVKLGLEVDWFPPGDEPLGELLGPYPWDYLLGSVHWVDGLSVDSSAHRGAWREWPPEQVWRRYAEEWATAVRSGRFDVMSHPDLAKIFGVRGDDGEYATMAAAAEDGDVALEISTAGLRKPVGELYPDERLLRLSSAPVTLASDAHFPAQVGEDFEQALELARSCGRNSVSVFEGRVRRQEPLG